MEEVKGQRKGREDRSDAQVPRYTFSFHLLGALSETEKSRKKEKEKRREQREHARSEEEVIGKNFGHSPVSALIGQSFSIRFAILLARGKKGMRRKGYVAGAQQERHIPAVVYR